MSKGFARIALTLAILCFGGATAFADEIDDLNDQYEMLELRIKVANKQKDLITLQSTLAITQRDIAAALLKAEQDKLAAAQEALKRPITPIRMTSGTLKVLGQGEAAPSCNALPFLRWKCNGEPICEFTVAADICGIPANATDPMELSLTYDCNGVPMRDVFPFNRPARLTCK